MTTQLGYPNLKKFKKSKFYKFLRITVFGALFFVFFSIIGVFVFWNFHSTNPANRSLIIVMESNGYLTPEDQNFYYEHKNLSNFVFMHLLGIKKEELEDKDFLTLLDSSIDKGLANLLKRAAKRYGRVVILTEREATFENFIKIVTTETQNNRQVDIITFLHGGEGNIYFRSQFVLLQDISRELSNQNIGFVYQTNCYGQTTTKTWVSSGAKVANGSEGINSMVLLAPETFLRLMLWGFPFDKAINISYQSEVVFWKVARLFIENIYWTDSNSINSSNPIIVGDGSFKLN